MLFFWYRLTRSQGLSFIHYMTHFDFSCFHHIRIRDMSNMFWQWRYVNGKNMQLNKTWYSFSTGFRLAIAMVISLGGFRFCMDHKLGHKCLLYFIFWCYTLREKLLLIWENIFLIEESLIILSYHVIRWVSKTDRDLRIINLLRCFRFYNIRNWLWILDMYNDMFLAVMKVW